jgi:hypothetical protein
MIPDFGRIKSDVLWGQSGLIYTIYLRRTRSWWRYTTKRNPDFEMEMLENQQVQNKKSLLKLPLYKETRYIF